MYKKYFENKKAAFFDLDGTIIDSLPYWEEAHQIVYQEVTDNHHISLPMIKWGAYVGEIWKNISAERDIKTEHSVEELTKMTQQKYLDLFRNEPLEERSGFWELMYELKEEKQYKLALVSNSERLIVEEVLKMMELNQEMFDFTIAGDEVKNRKPAPDIYKKALKALGLKSEEVIVFEDSLSGTTAANKAGLDAIIIWSGDIKATDYPKNAKEFFPDFSALPGNLDEYFYESLKQKAEDYETQYTTS